MLLSSHRITMFVAALLTISNIATPAAAQADAGTQAGPTYADLADLSQAATLVVRATIRKQSTLAPDRAPVLPPVSHGCI